MTLLTSVGSCQTLLTVTAFTDNGHSWLCKGDNGRRFFSCLQNEMQYVAPTWASCFNAVHKKMLKSLSNHKLKTCSPQVKSSLQRICDQQRKIQTYSFSWKKGGSGNTGSALCMATVFYCLPSRCGLSTLLFPPHCPLYSYVTCLDPGSNPVSDP